ncbi:MAG: ATP-binding protein [Sphingomonadales bacterium]|nr:MAG: ATP-binding protein [Sphingomonadales bacterium]
MPNPQIRRLELTRFRGFESLVWTPGQGVNVVLGGGDVGKTTILDAISLLLHPTNSYLLSDADYRGRIVEDEFLVEAVMYLPESTNVHELTVAGWPWEWDGANAVHPLQGADDAPRDPVYRVRARGNSELELVHELIQPDGSAVSFPISLRRRIGIVRLAGDDRSDRDLRLIQGGGLDRLLEDKALRAKLGRKIARDGLEAELTEEAGDRLAALDRTFEQRALPSALGLGFVGGPGLSINALVGLTARANDTPLSLMSWGAGTRRLSALAIADSLQDGAPITVIDEVERGLEPYRQRRLMQSLVENGSQTFVTTHSGFAITAAVEADLWYVDSNARIGQLPREKIRAHQIKDPETFLARMAVIAEGDTEVGFLQVLLEHQLSPQWRELGLHVSSAGGNDNVLLLLEALLKGGIRLAGIADREEVSTHSARWQRLTETLGDHLLRWPQGTLESNVLPFFLPEHVVALIEDPEGRKTGGRRRSLIDRLNIAPDSSLEQIVSAAGERLTQVVIDAALGSVPADTEGVERRGLLKGSASQWFKSVAGGRELAEKVMTLGLWPQVQPQFSGLVSVLREAGHG